MTSDRALMFECLALAEQGAGFVSPNPMVGAVIVKKGRVIARGFHEEFGGPHAEVNAIGAARGPLRGATLYVNLEPCQFTGKTPPCTELIISSGIRRVVVGMLDPNPRVRGRGIARLRQAGIHVRTGIAERECRRLNEFFAKYMTKNVPFVGMKIAQTLDGKIAQVAGRPSQVTNDASRRFTHHLRSRHDAVLVGAGTVRADNPRLTVRTVSGRNPIPVVVDGKFLTQPASRIYSRPGTILYTATRYSMRNPRKRHAMLRRGVRLCEMVSDRAGRIPLKSILEHLGASGIASLLIEGGAATFSEWLGEKAVDKLYVLLAPKIFGSGLPALGGVTDCKLSGVTYRNLEGDLLVQGYLQ